MKQRYIVTFADDGLHLYGPFPATHEHDALHEFGARWQADHGDDPRWNEIDLDLTGAERVVLPVPVVDPEDYEMRLPPKP